MSGETIENAEDYLDLPLTGEFAGLNASPYEASCLRLACWNIERGIRLREVADALAGPLRSDVYMLQEVDLYTRRTGCLNIPAELARRLAMNYVFGAEFEELAQGRSSLRPFHGQAVLSRLPIRRARILRFKSQPYDWGPWWKPRIASLQPRRGGRIALVVEIEWANSAIAIYNAHLESRTDDSGRAVQVREILHDVEVEYSPEIPVVVSGDLNTTEGARSPVVANLLEAQFREVFCGEPDPLATSVRSGRRLDWIFLRRLLFWDARVHDFAISDHFPLTVRITPAQAAEPNRSGLR